MNRGKKNNLIVIENGQIHTYLLDDKLQWNIGRLSKGNEPDIRLHSTTASRKHGTFQNMDGVWFYLDGHGKNGTVYNKKHIEAGMNGRVKPVMLSDGDVFVFGGGEEEVINSATIWAMFSTRKLDFEWRLVDTKGWQDFIFQDGCHEVEYHKPDKGLVVNLDNGMAIYMGDVTYTVGDVQIANR